MGNRLFSNAQGTIEYLVIIAIVVVIGLLVVGMMTTFLDSSSGVSGSIGKINSLTGPISISEAVVDGNGDLVASFLNNTGETLTITSLGVGDDSGKLNEIWAPGSFKKIYLSDIEACACDTPGQKKTCELTITVTNQYGRSYSKTIIVNADCVGESDSTGSYIGSTFDDIPDIDCPVNYVAVPANAGSIYQMSDPFCVMKFEAKNVGGVATSEADGVPWRLISFNNLITECSDLGTGHHLCTVKEAQTINRNIESRSENWNGNYIYRGNTDSSPGSPIAATDDDTNGYYGTGNSAESGPEQKRTHYLSTGEIIWDWSGNIWEFVYGEGTSGDVGNTGGITWGYVGSWTDWNESVFNEEREVFGPSNNSWSSINAMGMARVTGTSSLVFIRGGRYYNNDLAGIYALSTMNRTGPDQELGFRCCFTPQ